MVPVTRPRVVRVSGPLVEVEGLGEVAMSELVVLGESRLPGEVVAIRGGSVTVQAYEYTGGLATGDVAGGLGRPLSARLGPHLLGGVFDGLLRPLTTAGTWLAPGGTRSEDDAERAWRPAVAVGDTAPAGTTLGALAALDDPAPGDPAPGAPGTVPRDTAVEYRVLVPPGVGGRVDWVSPPGRLRPDERAAVVAGEPVTPTSEWPVRRPRPVRERLDAIEPLHTGQRVLDAVFPLARGSTAAVPGGFGTGKTMLLQQVAKWCTADVIVYVGCGERGNEMADVLGDLSVLTDPRTGRRLAERTVIIANTSNMPMMAREASIYSGVTVAEHFRDMGHDTVVIADSTSRWAEALREFASRSGSLPAEEGYPADLPSALAAFYERAGRVTTLGGSTASVTIVGAVSPPGGDTTEPVTAHTERFVRGLWALDRDLAYARHYPAVAWSGSFSRDVERLGRWYARHGDPAWSRRRARVTSHLAEADRIGDLAALVGVGSLPGHERVSLLAGRLLREGVLQQNALSPNDAHCTAAKTAALVDAVLAVVDEAEALLDRGMTASEVEEVDYSPLLRAAQETSPDGAAAVHARQEGLIAALRGL